MTFFNSQLFPTTQSSPTKAEPRINAQCLTSVFAPIIQGAPKYADANTCAVL